MKTTYTFGIFLFALLLGACNGQQSVKTDLMTGAYSRGNGLGCKDINVKINDKKVSRNTFSYGEKVVFDFNDMVGFKKIGKKAFPGLKLFVVKNGKDTVMTTKDLLDDLVDGTELNPLLVTSHLVAALPYKNNEKYKLHISIWDKKGDGTFIYELPFTVVQNPNLVVKAHGVKFNTTYLWNQTLGQTVADNKISQDEQLILITDGVKGLTIEDGKVFPILSVELIDKNGVKVINDANLLPQYETEGFDAEEFTAGQVPVTITFDENKIANPYTLRVGLKDKKSNRDLKIETKLTLH